MNLLRLFLILTLSISTVYAASRPSNEEVDFTNKVADTLTERLFALLLNEFANTTPENYVEGTEAIALVFDDEIRTFRLVGTPELDPLQESDLPQDKFEEQALRDALKGIPRDELAKSNGKWFIRRSIPLQNFDPSCQICHETWVGLSSDTYVGALMLRVPIERIFEE